MDLLVLACDAGMSLPDALKLAGEAAGREVGEEIRIVFEQVQSGTALSVALKEMADRTNVRAMEALARNVARGMRLGSPMSQVFRAQAHLVRQQHKQHLEAIIGALPMKMTLVAVLLLFPPMLVMILVPHLLLLFREW
ncbi:MAG TPA: type II secretion system F family protein [Firmicutes bacterium]|nr:type II secretion system F family protein [Bacillota bacterium]